MATGGGTPCFHDNMALMNANGITLYLKASSGFLLNNLLSDTGHRP
jgi:shikimate kinase